ncbi:MAG: integrase/recombinase XerD [Frankiaceae bacterium]|nr:integrase/recombinase XerD [Frankiaceae bacterium]
MPHAVTRLADVRPSGWVAHSWHGGSRRLSRTVACAWSRDGCSSVALPWHLARAHRVRPAGLLRLVPGPAARAAGRPAQRPRAVSPLDAGRPPVQAVHRVPTAVGRRRFLPNVRHRRRPGALPGRVRPATDCSSGVTHARADTPAVREAMLTAARQSSSPFDFALVCLLGLLGLRIFKTVGADLDDLGEEHGHRVLRVRGKGGKVVLVPLPPCRQPCRGPGSGRPNGRPAATEQARRPHGPALRHPGAASARR